MRTAGQTSEEAQIIADHLVDSELRGLSFGGLPRALSIVERLQDASRPRSPIRVVHDTPISASVDGGDQVGYLVARQATELAIKKAGTSGLAVVGAFNTWYTGMFSYYLEMITSAGHVGMAAGSAPQKVAPAGGTQGRFGTNPIAFGFPSTASPVIWDIGTSSVMAGEVVMRGRLGQLLNEGWAYDQDGEPTRDPAAALEGAFTVWGGHRGSGLAVVVQLLGMLAGAAAAPPGLSDCGFFLLVVNPAMLTDPDDFSQRVSEYADTLRSTRPILGGPPVRVPFDRSLQQRSKRLAAGTIHVPGQIHSTLVRLSTPAVPA